MFFVGKRCVTDQKYNLDSDNWMTIYIPTFYINRAFKKCVLMDEFKKTFRAENSPSLGLIKALIPGWEKLTATKDIISDEQIRQSKREIIKILKETQKEISNANNLQFRELIFEIRELRKAMLGYLIITNNKQLDAGIKEFEKYQMDLI